MYAHRHAAGMAVADLDVAVDHHRGAHESHGSHAMELPSSFNRSQGRRSSDRGYANRHTQAGGLLAEHHADILGAAKADTDDGRLAGEAALAECNQGVEIKALDALDTVRRNSMR